MDPCGGRTVCCRSGRGGGCHTEKVRSAAQGRDFGGKR